MNVHLLCSSTIIVPDPLVFTIDKLAIFCKRTVIRESNIDLEQDAVEALVGFHSFTGNDYLSSFFRR